MDVRRRVLVSGRVQGVFYRDACRDLAVRRGVRGWVRNRPDGRVEAVFEGPEPTVELMLAWCHEGPPRAVVTAVEVMIEDVRGESGFTVTG